MTLENFPSRIPLLKQITDRYAEYPGPPHDQPLYYPYEPSPAVQGHLGPPISMSSKHHFGGGGHKNNAAMSALTLLAFLFFLHILQQCLREHTAALNTPQVMIMTGGKEGNDNLRQMTNKKIDKTGVSETEGGKHNALNPVVATEAPNDEDDEKLFTKITSSEYAPWKKFQNNKNIINNSEDPEFY